MLSLWMRLLPYAACTLFVACVYALLAALCNSVLDCLVRNLARAAFTHPIHQVGGHTVAYFALLCVWVFAAIAIACGAALVFVGTRWLAARTRGCSDKGQCRPKVVPIQSERGPPRA